MRRLRVEVIGRPECPILLRRTLLSGRLGKVMLHEFLPTSRDRDHHDHPAAFLTIVLRGGYDDVRLDGRVDRLRAGSIRYRSATHAHKTCAGPRGATTLVLMGPKVRAWGFSPRRRVVAVARLRGPLRPWLSLRRRGSCMSPLRAELGAA